MSSLWHKCAETEAFFLNLKARFEPSSLRSLFRVLSVFVDERRNTVVTLLCSLNVFIRIAYMRTVSNTKRSKKHGAVCDFFEEAI